ncbi:MAG: hypothetical protein AAGA48_38930 [Myxococcota bacterium]
MNARTLTALLAVAGLSWSAPANAADTCTEVMRMLNLELQVPIVVQTINQRTSVTAGDVKCLKDQGAPDAVVEAAAQKAGLMTNGASEDANGSTNGASADGGGFDSVEALGGQLDLEDDISQIVDEPEPAEGGLPGPLQQAIEAQRAGKSQTAALDIYNMLKAGKYPRHNTRMLYTMGIALYDLQMYHSAQHYFLEVVRKGPNNPFFKYAMPKLTGIAKVTGNDFELLRIVSKIPPEAFPRQARNELYYLLGRRAYAKDNLSEAMSHFKSVSGNSDLYIRAKYFEGVITQQQGRLKSAVVAFREVIVTKPQTIGTARAAAEVENLKDLATLNIARIYYALERYDNADVYYRQVARDSDYWPRSLFERGWTKFLQGDLGKTLGLVLTVEAPYFENSKFIPDLTVLRALTFFNLCDWNETERLLQDFETTYTPITEEIDVVLAKFLANKQARKLWDQAYDRYFGENPEPTTLDQSMFNEILRNRDLAAIVDHLTLMDEEMVKIQETPAQWRETVGSNLTEIMQKDRLAYKKRAGGELLRELKKQNENLKDLLLQSEVIRFEVSDAQATDYAYRAKYVDDLESGGRPVVDYAADPTTVYWPFNGEFWRDELGYYEYAEQNQCR